MKELRFSCRGDWYRVNEKGYITTENWKHFSDSWVFLGGSRHHWSRKVTVPFKEAMKHPERLNGCLGWDCDHGTIRTWGGQYNGKLPRITGAHCIEV